MALPARNESDTHNAGIGKAASSLIRALRSRSRSWNLNGEKWRWSEGGASSDTRERPMIDHANGYLALVSYILITKALGLNFWQIEHHSRPIWLLGALFVLVVAVFWRRAPGRRSRSGRG